MGVRIFSLFRGRGRFASVSKSGEGIGRDNEICCHFLVTTEWKGLCKRDGIAATALKFAHCSRNLIRRADQKFRRTISGGTMTALNAGLIVAFVGAAAFVVVAVLTARDRIGRLPAIAARDSSSPSLATIDLSESAKKFRVFGWMLVLLLYLTAVFCLLQGFGDLRIFFHWDQWEAFFGSELSDRAEIELYSRFWMAIGVVLVFVGLWAQWRLRRRTA